MRFLAVATKKTVKIRKDRECENCGKLHKKGTMMLFGEWKDPKLDDDEKQIGIEYHRHYWCYDESNPHYIDEDGEKIDLLPCG